MSLTDAVAMVAIYGLLATSFHLVLRIGEVSFGQQAWFGVGAYAGAACTAILQWPVALALAAAVLASAVAGRLVCALALRSSGFGFALFTLVAAEFLREVWVRLHWQAGVGGRLAGPEGAMGFANVDALARAGWTTGEQAVLVLAVAAVAWLLLHQALRGRWGRLVAACAGDAELAQARGIDTDAVRLHACTAAAAVAGLAGGLFAHYVTFIAPDNFGLMAGVHALAYTLVGGVGHLLGPIAGTVLDVLLLEALRFAGSWRMVAFGLLLVASLILLPRGLFARRLPTRVAP